MTESVLFTFLHVLILVYWLGGDLGAFVASSVLTNADRPAAQRVAAAVIIRHVDMAPRTALILALPTGLALAEAKGWLTLGWPIVAGVATASLVWLWIAWRVQAGGQRARAADLIIRFLFISGLVLAALAVFAGYWPVPLFIGVKLVLLAAATALGLSIRILLHPFEAAFPKLLAGEVDAAANAAIRSSLARVRIGVLGIWAILVAAALFGLATPA